MTTTRNTQHATRNTRSAICNPQSAIRLLLLALTALGFYLRWTYLRRTNPYIDEFYTMLAAKAILEKGLPILPSGLFYELGLPFSYLDALAFRLLGFSETAARLPSLIVSGLTIPAIYAVGKRLFSPATGLLAAAVLALNPEAVVWGGRARMYALLQGLVLLAVFFFIRGAILQPRRRDWYAFSLLFGLALLTQFASVTLLPPLLIAPLVVAWLAKEKGQRPPAHSRPGIGPSWGHWLICHWSLTDLALLAVVVAVAFAVGTVGQLGSNAPDQVPTQSADVALLDSTADTLGNFVQFAVGWDKGPARFAEFFGRRDYLPLIVLAVIGLIPLGYRFVRRRAGERDAALAALYVLFGGVMVEMVTVVAVERRNPRYVLMILPLLFLIAAQVAVALGRLAAGRLPRPATTRALATLAAVAATVWFLWPVASAAALSGQETGYNRAARYVQEHWAEGDGVMSVQPAAVALYLGRCDYYASQRTLFLLDRDGVLVDRWTGAPLLDSVEEFNRVLASGRRMWLVVDRWRLRSRYEPFYAQQIFAQMEFTAELDEALVFVSRPQPQPVRETPAHPARADLSGKMLFLGYDAQPEPAHPGQTVRLTLFWQKQAELANYKVFVHLRDAENQTVAQSDHLPFGMIMPTATWRVGETMRDTTELTLPPELPPGAYRLLAGLYLPDTFERLPVTGDTSGENAIVMGTLTVTD